MTEWKETFQRALDLRHAGEFHDATSLLHGLLAAEAPSTKHRAALFGELGGLYLFDLDDPSAAREWYQNAVELSPRSEMASLGLFHSLVGCDELLEALDEMRRFLTLQSSDEYRCLLREMSERQTRTQAPAVASIRVRVAYLLVGSSDWHAVELSNATYFEAEEATSPELMSVPIHAHAADYLDVSVDRLRRTELTLEDVAAGDSRTVVETFWDRGRSRIIEVSGPGEKWELIVGLRTDDGEHIVRYGAIGTAHTLLSHAFVQQLLDGSERDSPVYSVGSDDAVRKALTEPDGD